MPRPFSAARLRRSASFSRLTGVRVPVFDKKLLQLCRPWAAAQHRKVKSGRPWEVGGLENHLPILRIYDRGYVTQEFVGFFCDVDRSVICRAIQRVEGLAKSLSGVRRVPKIISKEAGALIVDGTEPSVFRPGAEPAQTDHYSGKKAAHA